MKLVFTNLISNCIKYRDEEKPELHISITCQRIGNNYEISIKDNGIGIDEDQHDKIFGLFRRAYSKKDKSGSGAGLAIVRDIIKQHNGDVYVKESTPGKGTTISFIIPMGGIKK
jgi:signal transduction histidine kinase